MPQIYFTLLLPYLRKAYRRYIPTSRDFVRLGPSCEILKYLQVYEPYRSIVGQERGRTHRDLYERKKIN